MIHSAGAPGTLDGTALEEQFEACIAKNPIRLALVPFAGKSASVVEKTLLLFALTPQFLQQIIAGDELYTRVHKKVARTRHKDGRWC